MNEPLVQLDGVHTHYGASHILRGVSLTLHAGEAISLMGRNGMGKSTTLRTIMGHVRATGGRVARLGLPQNAPPHRVAAAGIAYVPEGRGIFPNLTVAENLTMAARPGPDGRTDWTRERVLATFPRLAERLDNWGNTLSGGEQQMLTIGRALMTNPRALLLDEATEGLAPMVREEIWSVVRAIRESGIAAIIVDKNVRRLAEVCDRHVVLVKGEVALACDTDELLSDPARLHALLGV